MLSRLDVSSQPQTATKCIALCCGCVGLAFLPLAGFGLLQRVKAAESIYPDRQISAAPTKIRPKRVASYGKLPLSFEDNQGQTDARVRFLARGGGYTIFLTDDEAVLALKKSSAVSVRSSVTPTIRSAHAGLKSGATSGDRPTTDDGPRTTDSVLRMKLVGANAPAAVTGGDELPGKTNYFLGNDPKKWLTNVRNYAKVKYAGVYPGVDLVYYGNQGGQLEYDFVVAPGADPNMITLDVRAGQAPPLQIAADGDLVIQTDGGEIRFYKPVVYQKKTTVNRQSSIDNRQLLDGQYVLQASNQVRFKVPCYDHTRPLFIDPVLSYSTYLGGSVSDAGNGIAVDSSGNAYVAGVTFSTNFPTVDPFQARCDDCGPPPSPQGSNAFVAKLNATGTALVYSTYLGGSAKTQANGIAVDSSGNAYVTGLTLSTNFPTMNPYQATNKAGLYGTAFVTKLNPVGSALVYSTYLGGSQASVSQGIAVDSSGAAYVTGGTTSPDFPTVNPLPASNHNFGNGTAFVSKLNAAGSGLVYSTFLGGSNIDAGNGIAVDAAGNAYVTGYTGSSDFPTMNPIQATCGDNCFNRDNAFVTKLNPAGSALVYSTFLGGSEGGSGDLGRGIAVDSSGNTYVTGWTESTNFPTVNPVQATINTSGGYETAFVSKLSPAGSALVYSTYLGGSSYQIGSGIAADSSGNAYVVGGTGSSDFPTVNPIQATNHGSGNAFVAELIAAGSALVYSTYLGGSGGDAGDGIAVDSFGNAYVTGATGSLDFPLVHPIQASNNAAEDNAAGTAFVAKISPGPLPSVSLSPTSLTFGPQQLGATSAAQTETVTNTGTANLNISTVTIGGSNASDFATSADTCSGATVTPNDTCMVSVTFTPSATGSLSASLNFTDNASGSPQSVALSGSGPDFTVAPPSGSSTSATVAPGSPASYTLSVGGEAGLSGTVTFTCTGAPSEATCTVSPNPVTVGSSATNVTVTVTTTAPSVSAPRSRPLPPVPPLSPGLKGLLMLALVIAAMAWVISRRNQPGVSRCQSTIMPLAAGLLLMLALAGCGGGGGGGGGGATSNPGTPAGTSTLTVTGTTGSGSSTLSHSVTLTLIVS